MMRRVCVFEIGWRQCGVGVPDLKPYPPPKKNRDAAAVPHPSTPVRLQMLTQPTCSA